MGIFEKVAVIDLKVKLTLLFAGPVFAISTVVGMVLIDPDTGLLIGGALGLVLAAIVAYIVWHRLP